MRKGHSGIYISVDGHSTVVEIHTHTHTHTHGDVIGSEFTTCQVWVKSGSATGVGIGNKGRAQARYGR